VSSKSFNTEIVDCNASREPIIFYIRAVSYNIKPWCNILSHKTASHELIDTTVERIH
jgi:hypothetical protein